MARNAIRLALPSLPDHRSGNRTYPQAGRKDCLDIAAVKNYILMLAIMLGAAWIGWRRATGKTMKEQSMSALLWVNAGILIYAVIGLIAWVAQYK